MALSCCKKDENES